MPAWTPGPPCPIWPAYHCQQAAEKLAKSFLVLAGVGRRKTHSLDELAGQVAQVDPVSDGELQHFAWITGWGFAYRYPEEEPQPEPTREEVEAVLAAIGALRDRLGALLA